jgi:hypothetical protein
MGKYFEQIWGSRYHPVQSFSKGSQYSDLLGSLPNLSPSLQLPRFLGRVVHCTLIMHVPWILFTCNSVFILFMTRNNSRSWHPRFGNQANGMGGLLCALVVGYKQAIPEHNISIFGLMSLRVKVGTFPFTSL